MAPIAKLGAASPLLTVFGVVSAWQNHVVPAVDADTNRKCDTEPQFAVGTGNVMTALLLVWPPVPVDAVVLPALCVPAQFASELVTATRA